jgi:hypothetical protein
MINFNFDEWANLYRDHPEEFERKRKDLLDAEIAKAPIARRNDLRMLQMECDAYRQSLPPLQAANEMSKLMVEKVYELQDSFLDLGIACQEFDKIRKLQ